VNLLLWFSYLVTIALYANAFGSCGFRLASEHPSPVLHHALVSAAILPRQVSRDAKHHQRILRRRTVVHFGHVELRA